MKKVLHYAMTILLIVLCGSRLSFSRTERLLHEWCGIVLFLCILLHLAYNRKWFQHIIGERYSARIRTITAIDILMCILLILIVASSMVISGHVFAPLGLKGASWGRRVHFVGTAWLFLLSGVHLGMHRKAEKRNMALYIAGAGGIAAFVFCRFYERLLLLNEFAYMQNVPKWTVYVFHALMFLAFMCIGEEIKRLYE